MESYKKKRNDLNFLHISLAHFQSSDLEEIEDTDSKNLEGKRAKKESVLEGKILNQLIHQISFDRNLQTNFKVKRSIKTIEVVKSTVIILILVLTLLYFIFLNPGSNMCYHWRIIY